MKQNICICPICGKGKLKKEFVKERFEYKGQSISMPNYLVFKCDTCDETIVDKGTLKSSGKLLETWKKFIKAREGTIFKGEDGDVYMKVEQKASYHLDGCVIRMRDGKVIHWSKTKVIERLSQNDI
jgi:YgiT-type zinc finger domain-containing protein